jgi:hypothetical protein
MLYACCTLVQYPLSMTLFSLVMKDVSFIRSQLLNTVARVGPRGDLSVSRYLASFR